MENDRVIALGIDLGTSNSVVAYVPGDRGRPEVVDIVQIVSPGRTASSPLLPSVLYVPYAEEFRAEECELPWDRRIVPCGEIEAGTSTGVREASPSEAIVGIFARERGALAPDRVVHSAKSWLCNGHSDPRSRILPWQSLISERRWSPLEASQRYLFHLRQALEEVRPGACAHDTPVVLTVPASFDESARELTRQAAVSAGWGEVLLLEEPLAALYAWLDYHRDEWRTILQPGDLVLICDVGGGTTDLSLVAVDEEEGELRLERVAVGEHILLGGDNMDLAIAHTLRQELADRGEAIDDWQFLSLVHASRAAKETLLLDDSLIEVPISIASRSASLFATTLSTKISKERVLELLLEGYFPRCAATDVPQKAVSFGLREIGLEYAADPAVTRHIAAFLRQSARNVMSDPKLRSRYDAHRSEDGAMLLPTRVLFNGGVFRAPPFRRRILELCSAWSGGREIRELASAGLDTAVAHGAAVYGGLVRAGESVRVRAGIGRSYYVGLQRSTPAVPGIKPAVQALCIAPQGMEEGGERELSGHAFGAVVGEPVEFRLFHSASRAGDDIGAVVRDAERELSESVPVRAHLTPPEGIRAGEVLPVVLRSRVTELGVLELALRHRDGEARWLLQFSVRDRPERDPSEPAGAAL